MLTSDQTFELQRIEDESFELAREIATGMRMSTSALDLAVEQSEFVTALQRFADDGCPHV